MVKHLNGMFAFALWDARRRRLFLARDRFGEKTAYWGVFDNTFLFASEPKVLLAHPAVRPSLKSAGPPAIPFVRLCARAAFHL